MSINHKSRRCLALLVSVGGVFLVTPIAKGDFCYDGPNDGMPCDDHSDCPGGYCASNFSGCGVLLEGVECLLFFPLPGAFPGGLTLQHVENFQPGDTVLVTGVLIVGCITGCQEGEGCIRENSVEACSFIPTVSGWGLVGMTLLVLVAGTVLFRRQRYGSRVSLVSACALLALSTPTSADETPAQAAARMLQFAHDPERLLVRFNPGVSQEARGVAHTAAGAVRLMTYRYVEGLTLVNAPGGDLAAALTSP